MAKSCFDCTEKNPAHSLCTHCNKWLCSTCAEQHRHSKSAGDHFLSQRGSGPESGFLFCPLHNQETLRLFCETCDVLMCRHCLLLEHKDHRFRRLDEALQNQRVLLENVITQVEEKKVGVQAAGKQIEDRLYEVKHMHRKVENQIKMTKMVIINELNKRINALLEQLEKITSEKQHKLEQQLQSVLVLNRQLEHVQNFINWAMYGKNSISFLFSKELIVFQMQRLLETNCGSDFGRPMKLKFSWEPSYWSKQIANLGNILTEGANAPQMEVASYGSVDDAQSTYYQTHHTSSTPHPGSINTPQAFPSPVQCPTPVCCAHCYTLPLVTKGQSTTSSLNPHITFAHPTGIKQQPLQPVQYNSGKEQRCTSRPLRVIQPWLTHQPSTDHESSSYWVEQQKQQQVVQPIQTVPPVCSVTTQDFGQIHNVHTTVPLSTPSLQAPSVQMQLGPVHSVSHIQQQRHQHPAQPTLCQTESAPEQVMHHSLDIINQQFELEQMQKGLELLLQSQPSNVQLNQSKQPQHVQQTIVGQINYIVRQPATVPMQTQEDVPQVCDDTISPGHTVDLSPVTTNSPGIMQTQSIADEIIAAVESDACRMNQFSANPVRKRSASVSFPNTSELELSSPRLSRSVDPQMQAVSCQFFGQGPERPFSPVTETERTSYSTVEAGISDPVHLGSADHLATTAPLLGNAICKVENEDFSCGNSSITTALGNDSSNTLNDLVMPLENIFDEPINLSIKRCVPSESSSVARRNNTPQPPPPPPIKQLKNEADENHSFNEHFTEDIKRSENTNRSEVKETKIPYVRLERLKICPPDSGELPVFKVQPQNKDEDGSLRLLIKYGARSKSMSIKVNPDSPYPSPSTTDIPSQLPLIFGSESVSQMATRSFHQLPQQVKPFSRLNAFASSAQESRGPLDLSDSSMGSRTSDCKVNAGPSTTKKSFEDPNQIENEDFCAVCLNGGEMLCCDHCPKVFHLSCHVPALLSFPVGEWVCTLCRNLNKPEEYDCDNIRYSLETKDEEGNLPNLDEYDQRRCEKMVLSLCCNNLSLPFQEPVSPLARHYFQIIKRPMDLSIIRKKLQRRNVPHYSTPEELAYDIRLMFWNCAKFNYEDSEVAVAGRKLELFFENMLKETYPDKIFPFPQEEDSDSEEIDNENCPLGFKAFHWPSYGAECIQPKRRRRHTVGQKTKEFTLC
ncbi:tripartite motif-containing 66 isoform X1 [Pelobates cultripes]|nr:tripartite motif-containing 66 isoform X1 [Pelobates cultripes]